MSLRTRNPFKIRRSEKIESDTTFLRIYSPIIIEDLLEKHKEDKLWNDFLFIRSSPGAGKSSLLRIFEPATLVTLFNSKSSSGVKDLREYLRKIDVIDNERIKLLGVCLHCNRNYEILEDLPVDDLKKKRFFFGLLNARIILTALRGILTVKRMSFPSDLHRISFAVDNPGVIPDVNFPCNGEQLYAWAVNIERLVYKALDSFLPIDQIQPQGHNELFTLSFLTKASITVDNEAFSERILFMFDDAHKLSVSQRNFLVKYIIEQRYNFSIWISERREALANKENLRSYHKRDYNELDLEGIWQSQTSKFKSIVANIAFRRASISTEDVPGFEENLEASINEQTFKVNFIDSFNKSLLRLDAIAKHTSKFNGWINFLKTLDASELEKASIARGSEILANRNLSDQQFTLDVELPVTVLKDGMNSSLENASEFFLFTEAKTPYYYSFERVVQGSSVNIDQFLQFAGELYESMLSNRVARRSTLLSAEEQHKIMKRVANENWRELERLIPFADMVKKFLQKFYEFAVKESTRPSFPYPPGVTGFALKDPASLKLIEEEHWLENELFSPLLNVLGTCVSFNLVEKQQINHGKKGSAPTTVFYLNRWLCIRYNLPLGYGGWRSLKPEEVLRWIKST